MNCPTQIHLSEFVVKGLHLHAQGELSAADACYAEALDGNASDAEAFLLRGIVARELGNYKSAVRWSRSALRLQPASPRVHLNLGRALCGAGRLNEAQACLRRALVTAPQEAQLWCCLGEVALLRGQDAEAHRHLDRARHLQPRCWVRFRDDIRRLMQQRRYAEATVVAERALRAFPEVEDMYLDAAKAASLAGEHLCAKTWCEAAIALQPENAAAWVALGHASRVAGALQEALQQYERAAVLRPADAAIQRAIADTLFGMEHNKQAREAAQRAIAMDLQSAESWHLLGQFHAHEKKIQQAESCFRRAIDLAPDDGNAHNALGALILLDRPEEGAVVLREAMRLLPRAAVPLVNFGITMMLLGDTAAMRQAYVQAVTLEPDCAGAQYNLSLAELREGLYRSGWERYEHRWGVHELKLTRRHAQLPQWRGEPIVGKTILLHAEQGLGDALQFMRFATEVAALGARVVLEVPASLARVARSLRGVDRVVEQEAYRQTSAAQLHCPLMSLPHALGTTIESIPAQNPYLQVNPADAEAARARFRPAVQRAGLRVGLVWAGNPGLRTDSLRSMALLQLAPLLEIQGITYFSLQQGTAQEQLQHLAAASAVVDAGPELHDFYDTAALIQTLDLLISVDTSCAHMAGALGVPVWVLVARQPDWRWIQREGRSPWYPTARVFQQQADGWEGVVHRICIALRQTLHQKRLALDATSGPAATDHANDAVRGCQAASICV